MSRKVLHGFARCCGLAVTMGIALGGCRHASPHLVPAARVPESPTNTGDDWVAIATPDTAGNIQIQDGTEPNVKLVTDGAFRAVVNGNRVEVAPDVSAQPFVLTVQFRGSWYFITQDGDIFRAATFLGKLSDTGLMVGRGAWAFAETSEHVLLVAASHALWAFNAVTVSPLKLPPPGYVIGVRQHPGGRVVVDVCGQHYWLRSDGTLEPNAPPPDFSNVQDHTLSLMPYIKRVDDEIKRRGWRALGVFDASVALPNGSVVPTRQVMPHGREKCAVRYAGKEPLIICSPVNGQPRNSDDDLSLTQLGTVFRLNASNQPEPWFDVPFSDDPIAGSGPALLANGDLSYVWIHAGRRDEVLHSAISFSCGFTDDTLAMGLSGKWALFTGRQGEKVSFALVNLESRDSLDGLETHALTEFLPRGARLDDVGMSADQSTLYGLFHDLSNGEAVALGPVGGQLNVESVPANTRAVAFVDGSRGVAVGRHLGEVWSTLDGAAHWFRLNFPQVAGDPAAVPLRHDLACTLLGCSSQGFEWVDPRVLSGRGFMRHRFIAPRRVRADRVYDPPIRQRLWPVARVSTEDDPCPTGNLMPNP